jgi:hypothetical protein
VLAAVVRLELAIAVVLGADLGALARHAAA